MPLVVMVSYQSADKSAALLVRDELMLRGMTAILDQDTFHSGHRIEHDMVAGVQSCDAFIALMTPHYLYEHAPPGTARPAIDQEFKPVMDRRRKAQACVAAADRASARPLVVPVLHGLGHQRLEAPDRVRRATGEDIGGVWSPSIDQGGTGVSQPDAAMVAEKVLLSLLANTGVKLSAPIDISVVSRGTGQPPHAISIDATRLLGGQTNQPGSMDDWQRFLVGLQDVQAVLSAATTIRELRMAPKAHLTAALAFGRVFHQAAGWRLTVDGHNGSTMLVDEGSSIEAGCDPMALTSRWLMVEIQAIGQPVHDLATTIIQQAATVPRARLQLTNPNAGPIATDEVGRMAADIAARMRAAIAEYQPQIVHLVCASPVELAVLVGSRLTSLHADLQLYERDGANYQPSLLIPAAT